MIRFKWDNIFYALLRYKAGQRPKYKLGKICLGDFSFWHGLPISECLRILSGNWEANWILSSRLIPHLCFQSLSPAKWWMMSSWSSVCPIFLSLLLLFSSSLLLCLLSSSASLTSHETKTENHFRAFLSTFLLIPLTLN